jgi:hypothetical protein
MAAVDARPHVLTRSRVDPGPLDYTDPDYWGPGDD